MENWKIFCEKYTTLTYRLNVGINFMFCLVTCYCYCQCSSLLPPIDFTQLYTVTLSAQFCFYRSFFLQFPQILCSVL